MSVLNNFGVIFVLLFLAAFQFVAANDNATPEQLNGIKLMVMAHLNYFRALSAAPLLTWDDTLTGISDAQAMNCSLQYDVSS